jgi:hypothetical protein
MMVGLPSTPYPVGDIALADLRCLCFVGRLGEYNASTSRTGTRLGEYSWLLAAGAYF